MLRRFRQVLLGVRQTHRDLLHRDEGELLVQVVGHGDGDARRVCSSHRGTIFCLIRRSVASRRLAHRLDALEQRAVVLVVDDLIDLL